MAKKDTKETTDKSKVKATPKAKKTTIKIVKGATYKFKANAKAPFMLDGKVYKVPGEIAEILVGRNYGVIEE